MSEKGNRTVALVELLSKKERSSLGKQLDGGKRSSLAFLFHGILSGLRSSKPSGLSKELLYRMTFDEPYDKDKDYLLRNEFRLLSKELIAFLSYEQIKKNIRDNPLAEKRLFLQSLVDRKAVTLFNKEWQKSVSDAIEQLEYGTALDIQRMAIDQLVQHRQATIENYNELMDLLADYQRMLKRYFLHEHLFGKHKQAFTERTLQALGTPQEISPIQSVCIDPLNSDENDDFANHIVSLAQSYQYSGKEKITLLKKAASFVEEITAKRFDQKGALASINAGIALEYFLLREFEASLPFHRNALHFGTKLEGAKLISFVFNYLSTLLRLENHGQAISLIDDYADVWQKLPRMRDRFLCLKAMCHVFEKDPKSAEACIPEDRKSGGMDHYYYYRFIQVIILYLKDKAELAMNEAENFEHTVRYNDKDEDYLRLVQDMKKFLTLKSEQASISADNYKQKSQKLISALSNANENVFADRALLYRWIISELQ